MSNPYKRREDDGKADVGDYVAAASASQQWDFYGTALFALAIGLESAVSGLAGHHARSGVGYLFASLAAIIAFGVYFFRTYTGRPDAFKILFVVMHFILFVGLIVIFVWGMVESFIDA